MNHGTEVIGLGSGGLFPGGKGEKDLGRKGEEGKGEKGKIQGNDQELS
jgi:hypothetical protein